MLSTTSASLRRHRGRGLNVFNGSRHARSDTQMTHTQTQAAGVSSSLLRDCGTRGTLLPVVIFKHLILTPSVTRPVGH